MSTRLNRPLFIVLILFLLALLAYSYKLTLLFGILIVPIYYIRFKYMNTRMYFGRDELLDRDGHNKADEPLCGNCDYDLRGTFAAGIYECPECNQRADEETITNWNNAKHTV